MNKTLLSQLIQLLSKLNPEIPTKVSYNPKSGILGFYQRGHEVRLYPLRGLIKVVYNDCILLPNELHELMINLEYCMKYEDELLYEPTSMGYRVYGRDLNYLDQPRIICDLNFYSIKNRLLIWLSKLTNSRIRQLMEF